jgi:hypothetical protein
MHHGHDPLEMSDGVTWRSSMVSKVPRNDSAYVLEHVGHVLEHVVHVLEPGAIMRMSGQAVVRADRPTEVTCRPHPSA